MNIQNLLFPYYYTTYIIFAIGVIYAYDFCSRNDILLTEYHCPVLCSMLSHWEHETGHDGSSCSTEIGRCDNLSHHLWIFGLHRLKKLMKEKLN